MEVVGLCTQNTLGNSKIFKNRKADRAGTGNTLGLFMMQQIAIPLPEDMALGERHKCK